MDGGSAEGGAANLTPTFPLARCSSASSSSSSSSPNTKYTDDANHPEILWKNTWWQYFRRALPNAVNNQSKYHTTVASAEHNQPLVSSCQRSDV